MTDAEYDVMDSQHLKLADGSIDAALSRFGRLSFAADRRGEAREVNVARLVFARRRSANDDTGS